MPSKSLLFAPCMEEFLSPVMCRIILSPRSKFVTPVFVSLS